MENQVNKIELAARVYPIAEAAFENGETITYGDLARAVDYKGALWHGEWADVLAIVAIQSVHVAGAVVRKDTGKPGKGHDRFVQVLNDFHTGAISPFPRSLRHWRHLLLLSDHVTRLSPLRGWPFGHSVFPRFACF
jgi:hypothetical protein